MDLKARHAVYATRKFILTLQMTSDETNEWDDFPLFAPDGAKIPQLAEDSSGENISSAIGALSHLLYDEETPLEASELLRDEGNRYFKLGGRLVSIWLYSKHGRKQETYLRSS